MLCCRSWSRSRGVGIEMRLFSSWSVETRHSVIRTFVHSPLTASQQFAARVGWDAACALPLSRSCTFWGETHFRRGCATFVGIISHGIRSARQNKEGNAKNTPSFFVDHAPFLRRLEYGILYIDRLRNVPPFARFPLARTRTCQLLFVFCLHLFTHPLHLAMGQ